MKKISFIFLSFLITGNIFSQNVALNFDGANDLVQTTYSGISGSAARTIEARIRTTANCVPTNGGIQNVIVDYGTFATGARFTFNVLWGNAIRIEVGGSGLGGTVVVNDGLWHHVACVYDPNAVNKYSLYVDGVLDVAGNITTPINTGSSINMRIGQRVDGANHFDGDIDEVRFFNFARTASDILADMNAELCVLPVGLTAYYKLNDGIANGSNISNSTATDDSGNINNGTLTNFSLMGVSSNWISGAALTQGGGGSTLNITECVSYTSPSGNNTWTNTGTYFETFSDMAGCDSTVTFNLTIGLPVSYMSGYTCDEYLSPSGHYLWDAAGTYFDTIPNANGCDTIVIFTLSIPTNDITLFASACGSYTTPDGNDNFTVSGLYPVTYTNVYGCDSVVNYNITILNSSTSEIDVNSCGPYTSPSGNSVWDSNGTYVDIISNTNGCDSSITINLTVLNIDITVSGTTGTLSSNQNAATYQWYTCDDINNPITGETNQDFTPTLNGVYAVGITIDNCTLFSDCITIENVGVIENQLNSVKVYPNPTNGPITILLEEYTKDVSIIIIDIHGKEVYSISNTSESKVMIYGGLSRGIYFVRVNSPDGMITNKITVL